MARGPGDSIPGWWPERVYYGWALVATLGVTAAASYGVLTYAFAAFIIPMGAELGWSTRQITGAFSLAHLVAGLAAIPAGRLVDRHGTRWLMTGGSILATLLLLAWSQVQSLVAFYAIWTAMGVAMAAVLYEPAFGVIATWFREGRARALTVLTFMGGFASVIFVPLATFLIASQGWRGALLSLALIYALWTILPHALLLRRNPGDVGLRPSGIQHLPLAEGPQVRSAVSNGAFGAIAVAFTLSAFTTTAMAVHLIPLLLERGHGMGFAGAAMAMLGLMALPGRLVFTPLGGRISRRAVTSSIFAFQAMALLVLMWSQTTAGVWVFVLLFGAGFGAITPARAALVADFVPASSFGRVNGPLALLVALARAAAPFGASMLYAWGGGYGGVLAALLTLTVASGIAAALTGERNAPAPLTGPEAAHT